MMDAALAAGGKPVAQLPLANARQIYSQRYAERSMTAPEGVATRDVAIRTPEGEIPGKLYRPPGGDHALPLLVYFHGGGFVLGDAAGYAAQCAHWANDIGCAVLFPQFRLAPEHAYPAALHDAFRSLEWAHDHAHELGIDPQRTAVAGDSAGGNLAANVAIAARDGEAPRVALQVLCYPLIDFRPYVDLAPATASAEEFSQGYWLDRNALEWFARCYLQRPEESLDPRVSPLLVADAAGLPPAIVLTAAFDPLRDEGRAYARRLREAGVAVTDWCIEGMIHNFLGHTGKSSAARAAYLRLAREIKGRLAT
jgi:acetyl esterase